MQLARLFEEQRDPGLAGGSVVDPEEDDAHLVEPEQGREVPAEVRRHLRLRALDRRAKVRDALLPDLSGLLAERRERTRGVAGGPEERAEKVPERPELLELGGDQRSDSRAK